MANLIHKEKRLAYLLRHDSSIDVHGWRKVHDIIENHGFTMDELREIVATSNKQRFEFSKDMSCIRARQGHSVKVDVELEEAVPPECLYHGTLAKNVPSIVENGILKKGRLHVHLSVDEETAMKVGGRRKGEVVILKVAARKMWEDGYCFWMSRNGVWLTETVLPKYLEI